MPIPLMFFLPGPDAGNGVQDVISACGLKAHPKQPEQDEKQFPHENRRHSPAENSGRVFRC